MVATVMFTDIVGSTERAAQIGDRRWRELRAEWHEMMRREVATFRGREVDTAGDGLLATFDGPARRSDAWARSASGVQHGERPGGGLRLEFVDRGSHALKGVPGDWRLFVVP